LFIEEIVENESTEAHKIILRVKSPIFGKSKFKENQRFVTPKLLLSR